MTPGARALVVSHVQGEPPPTWPVDHTLLSAQHDPERVASARSPAELSIDEAAEVNGCVPPTEMRALLRAACRHLLRSPLTGVGIDLGAGLGVLAAAVAELPGVDGVIALEVHPPFVEVVIPSVAETMLGPDSRRVVPVRGSFDAIGLPDADLDFAVELHALHHANDLDVTLAEVARVLKPGAPLLAFDRVQPDDMPDWLRERMLDHQHSEEQMARAGEPGIVRTRRESGEHEIRRSEWAAAFAGAGFRLERTVELVPRIDARLAAKSAVSWLPGPIRRRVVHLPAPRAFAPAWAVTRVARRREAVGPVVFAPMRSTGMLAVRI